MGAIAARIVGQLQDAGVRMLFGVPGGGGNLDLMEAAREAGLPFVLTSTENGAAIAAIAQAEITGQPGACLTTLGPGAASVLNGVACAHLDRVPLFVFTDSDASAALGAFTHQQLDQRALFAGVTRWSGRLSVDHADEVLEYAWASIAGPPPGPVHIECSADFETEPYPSRVLTVPAARPAHSADLTELQARVAAARQPLVIAGLGARRPDVARAVRQLCERRQVPAMVTYKAKGVVPDDHPRFAGVFTHGALERAVVADSDLLIGIGLDPVELLPRPWDYDVPIVYVGAWPVQTVHVRFASLHVTHDVAAAVAQIEAGLWWSDWDWDALRQKVDDSRRLVDIRVDTTRLSPSDVVRAVEQRLSPQARVAVDAGAHMFPATVLWPVREPGGLLISNGLSTMGFALPAAIGAALLDRRRPVVALTGDGGLLMCVGELQTAARERLWVIVVVFSDQSLSLIDIKQRQRGLATNGVSLGATDWAAIARGFGLTAWAVSDRVGLEQAVEQAAAAAGPVLIDARVDPSGYPATLKALRG
jgi:acetolactate synthase-1/2/3 large subunit